MRAIDGDRLKRKAQKVATEVWKMKIKANVEVVLNQFIDWINEAPTIEPEPHWIPCSDRLPDKPNLYIVTDHEGRVVRYVYNDNESSREYWKRCAKAWMPLPEPYKEDE